LAEPRANAACHTRSNPERAPSTGLSWSLLFAIGWADHGNAELFSSTAFCRTVSTRRMSDQTGIARHRDYPPRSVRLNWSFHRNFT
jgi:hypothetical protein